MADKKYLVVYYSRTGRTKKIGQEISSLLNCDFEEIVDLKKRSGIFGFLGGGSDARRGRMTNIEPVKRNPGEYDVVVIGTPVWAGTTAPAIRTYLDRFAPGLKSVAFFCTLGGTNISDTFDAMSRVSGKNPIATIWFSKKQIASGSYSEKLAEFSNKLK